MSNYIKTDFTSELKVEGINFKGYGILPKYVMFDPDLTLEAKAIYSYFCSYAGSGTSAFPSRDKILADLSLGKTAYYAHFKRLTEQGYITVEQSFSEYNNFGRNVYTLVSTPKKFLNEPEDEKLSDKYGTIRLEGLKAHGYGMIPKAVMLDTRLPLKAKGIYAYFCCLTGSGNVAFPKKETILFHIKISHNAYQRYYKQLVELNYITPVRRHINGRLSGNNYYLNENPDDTKKSKITVVVQRTSFTDTAENPDIKPNDQRTIFTDTAENPDIKPNDQCTIFTDTAPNCTTPEDTFYVDTTDVHTRNPDTNINNPNSNNLYNYQSINQDDGQTDEAFSLEVEKDEVEELIKTNVDYYRFADDDDSALKRIYTKCISLMVDACCTTEPYVRIGASEIPATAVRKRFCSISGDELDAAIERIKEQAGKVKNWTSYLLTSLYTAPVLSNIETDFAIYRDFESLKNGKNESYSL